MTLSLYEVGSPVGSAIWSGSLLNQIIGALAVQQYTFTGINTFVPDNLVFLISVIPSGNLDLGVNLYRDPTVGSSPLDGGGNTKLVVHDGSSYQELGAGGTPGHADVFFQLNAGVSDVPEPSTWLLVASAGMVLAAIRRRR